MLRLTWQGMETWPRSWRHSLTLPVRGRSGNWPSYLDLPCPSSRTCLRAVAQTAKLKYGKGVFARFDIAAFCSGHGQRCEKRLTEFLEVRYGPDQDKRTILSKWRRFCLSPVWWARCGDLYRVNRSISLYCKDSNAVEWQDCRIIPGKIDL